MARVDVIQSGMAGVDMLTNPLFLPEERLAGATNMMFHEGSILTRPGFRYHETGLTGTFQGGVSFSPSRGISHQPFADPWVSLVTCVGGKLHYNLSKDCYLEDPIEIKGENIFEGNVFLYQAENWLIAQSTKGNTIWWEGWGDYVVSPGLDATEDQVKNQLLEADVHNRELPGANIDCCFQKIEYCEVVPLPDEEEDFSSHDTFIWEKHRHFLLNAAGVGVYAHGRVHQEGHGGIYVSDIIHKRGAKYTDDILLMEEQQAGSFGDPLSAPTRMGQLRALALLPRMNTANGEGQLIAYYDYGVASFDTSAVPRETRFDAETGSMTQEGWSEIRQINHLLNQVSATGRYAVAVLPRDHAFRSRYGIHLLSLSLGEGSFNDEFINTLAQDVQPILDADSPSALKGVTVGHWAGCNRLLTSVGMIENSTYTSSAMGRGFVVWNQAVTFTEDRTPRPLWEGLWTVHSDIAGIHQLLDLTEINGTNMFGFLASKKSDAGVVFGEIDKDLGHDVLGGCPVPIEWDVTSRKVFNGFSKMLSLSDGRVEIEAEGKGGKLRVLVRTDRTPKWKLWNEFDTSDSSDPELFSLNLGMPPKDCREASWFQFRVEGSGTAHLRALETEIAEDRDKMNKKIATRNTKEDPENYFRFNTKPITDRWTSK